MPDRDVQTIRHLIYYQYAKVIARRAFSSADGMQAKGKNYGFIKQTFRKLKSGEMSWSDITREDWQLVEAEKKCIYCARETDLHREHLVPRSLSIKPECSECDAIQSIHNQVFACQPCNTSKGTKGLYEFYRSQRPQERKFYDFIPPLAEKKYLKTIMQCHGCALTLDCGDIDGDGEITVLDIDYILRPNTTPQLW
jgi:5-methylcytosine-specific restriction endonuclease McrA